MRVQGSFNILKQKAWGNMSVVYPDKALAKPGSLTYIVALSKMDVFLIKEGKKNLKSLSPHLCGIIVILFIYFLKKKKK